MQEENKEFEEEIKAQELILNSSISDKKKFFGLILWSLEIDEFKFEDTRTKNEIKRGRRPSQYVFEQSVFDNDKDTNNEIILEVPISLLQDEIEELEYEDSLNSKLKIEKIKDEIKNIELNKYLVKNKIRPYLCHLDL